MRLLADIMSSLTEMATTATGARQIRKTTEDPQRASVIDFISLITGHARKVCSHTLQRIQEAHPSLGICDKVKLPERGQHSTILCKIEQLEQILALLPWKAAAEFRATGKRRKRETQTDDLYVMTYNNNDSMKIGRSENVEKRRRSLEAGQMFFVEVVATFPGRGPSEAEVHKRLQQYHSKTGAGREWFNISAADATLVCSNTLKEIEQVCMSK
jgi:hypothetical protein